MFPSETDKDEGSQISLIAQSIMEDGICHDSIWTFDESKIFLAPSILADREAYLNKISGHARISSSGDNRLQDIRDNLSVLNPVVFGTEVGQAWMDYRNGSEPLGTCTDVKGRHAICCVGYVNGLFIIENSWGSGWGYDGFCFVKPEVLASNASADFWIIIEGSEGYIEHF
jgi:hypothetical protein